MCARNTTRGKVSLNQFDILLLWMGSHYPSGFPQAVTPFYLILFLRFPVIMLSFEHGTTICFSLTLYWDSMKITVNININAVKSSLHWPSCRHPPCLGLTHTNPRYRWEPKCRNITLFWWLHLKLLRVQNMIYTR